MEVCVISVKRGAEGPGPPKVRLKKDLDDVEAALEAREEVGEVVQHSSLKRREALLEDRLVGSSIVAALVPGPPSCGVFEAVRRSDLESIRDE
jgi:hypothetical protein